MRDVDEIVDVPVIEFVAPLPGFPVDRRFALVRLDDDGVLCALTSVAGSDLRFLVVPPAPFFPDYAPEIDDESLAALGVTEAEADSLVVLLVVTTAAAASDCTANLMAPIVLHERSRRAVQLVLAGSGLPVRAALTAG
jgi:flagellar assembly factor FliW